MAILLGKIEEATSHNTSPNINLFHVAIVAPWLYYISTGPTNWQTYLQLTALGVGSFHLYKAYSKMYHQPKLQKSSPLPVLF